MTTSPIARAALVASIAGALFTAACSGAPTDGTSDESVATTSESALTTTCSGIDTTKAAALAAQGAKRDGYHSQEACYAYVKNEINAATGVNIHTALPGGYQAGAYQFGKWADANPQSLAKLGFAKIDIGKNAPPKGAILVWQRGVCGYSKSWGHIEIVENDQGTRACSDFCGRVKTGCGTPEVYVPIKAGTDPKNPCGAADAGADSGSPDATAGDAAASDAAPQQDSCVGKSDGWYCSDLRSFSAYDCAGGQIAGGWQCATGQVCQRAGSGGQAAMSGQYPACGGGQ